MSDKNTEKTEATEPQVENPTEPTQAEVEAAEDAMFDRKYVEKLRAESADYRTKAKSAQEALDANLSAYRTLAVRFAAKDILKRPEALEWNDEWVLEDGTLDFDAITAAAVLYADENPHAATVSGAIAQGYVDSDSQAVNLADILRGGA